MDKQHARRICFVSPHGYPLLVPGAAGAGGAERQFFLFARGLAQRGWAVSFITGLPPEPLRGTAPCFPVFPVDLRYMGGSKAQLPAAWCGLWRAMRDADADYYALKVPAHLLPLMAAFCRRHGRRLASWGQTTYRSEAQRQHIPWIARRMESLGLRAADVLIAQTQDQAAQLEAITGRPVQIVANIAETLPAASASPEAAGCDVLWAGNTSRNKRPGVVVELARLMPDVVFAMAMNCSSTKDFERWRGLAAGVPNLRFLGQVAPAEMEERFGRTRLFLNTSAREGFPNTFLQAWMNGVPVVSLGIDPDLVLSRHGLGGLPETDAVQRAGENDLKLAECLVPVLRRLLQDPERCRAMGLRATRYVQERHAPEATIPLLQRVLTGCA